MKASITFYTTVSIGFGLLVSIAPATNDIQISLHDAINKGIITCTSTSTGGHSGNCVSLKLRNRTTTPYKILVPRGTLFFPSDPGEQTLISIDPQFFALNPSGTAAESVAAYCSEHSDRSPSYSTSFSIGMNKNPKFDSLFHFLANKPLTGNSHQDIVWAISDNSSVANISQDSKQLRDLRRFLCKITGQEEVDYAFDVISGVDENGYITQKTYQLKGFVEFNVDKTKWIHQEVYDATGKMKFKSQQAFEIPKGTSDYSFNIIVKEWPKGNYVLKLKNGSEVVENYPFKVS